MLRTRSPVRTLTRTDVDDALELCSRNVAAHVFVAARILETLASGSASAAMGVREDGRLSSLCWASSNVVPVETTAADRVLYAERMRRWRGRIASLLGPREEVVDLWDVLEPHWGQPRAVRAHQPMLSTSTPPSALGVELDTRVRPARADEVDIVLPAAAHMFTAEIGYPPYTGSSRSYRGSLAALIARGHTWVVVEDGEVVFKTDIGSLALGCAQLQGVWLAPHLRGQGLAVPMIASVMEQVMAGPAPLVSLYVNDFNAPALATYDRLGFAPVGEFTTVLL
ncbi:GNAT family N-acetyltransferase [Rothia sp. ARF10]|nr:GNAT family N-acetyltransferase [Rothia sp. ARF10]